MKHGLDDQYVQLLKRAVDRAAEELSFGLSPTREALEHAEIYPVTSDDQQNSNTIGAAIHFYPEDDLSGDLVHTYKLADLRDPPTNQIVDDLKERALYGFIQHKRLSDQNGGNGLIASSVPISTTEQPSPGVMITLGMFPQLAALTDEDLRLAEFHGDPDDGLEW